MKKTWSDRIFMAVCYLVIGLLGLAALIPVLNVISKSVSGGAEVTAGLVTVFPRSLQFETVSFVLFHTPFLKSLFNTILVTAVGTFMSVLVTVTTAYPLSRPNLKGRNLILILYIFSMVFYGGIVPSYMVVKTLGILDSYAALILPFVIVPFNMLIVKNYFEGLPISIEESAKLDGAGYFSILFLIVLPMSKPVLATVSLLYAVNYWNNYFHAMLYTSSASMKTLQLFLYDMVYNSDETIEQLIDIGARNISIEGLKSAAVVLSMIPIIAIYPFVQKYFVSGITIGSVKG